MKKLAFILLVFFIFSCKKEELNAGPEIQIETQLFYSIEPSKAEATVEILNVKQELAETGVVLAEKPDPSTADRVISVNKLGKAQSLILIIDNLVKGKTYYLRSFYKTTDGKIVYGNSLSLVQNFDNRWSKVESPNVSSEEYILTENVFGNSRFGGIQFTKVDPVYNKGINTYFFPNFYQWDPRFFNLDISPYNVRFNEINAPFVSAGSALILKGAGYQKLPNGDKFFLKDLIVVGASGYKYDPQYPGANKETTSFGLDKYPYVIENTASGVIWQFDYEGLKWNNFDKLPFDFDAKYYSYVADGKVFILVEPRDLKAPLAGFYEYQIESKKWKKLSDFKGENRRRASGFVYNGKVYFGAGQSSASGAGLRDYWVYDPKTETWAEAFTYPGGGTLNLAAISYEGFVFAGFGQSVIVSPSKGEKFKNMKDFWSLRLR
jgi:hypothetical protein